MKYTIFWFYLAQHKALNQIEKCVNVNYKGNTVCCYLKEQGIESLKVSVQRQLHCPKRHSVFIVAWRGGAANPRRGSHYGYWKLRRQMNAVVAVATEKHARAVAVGNRNQRRREWSMGIHSTQVQTVPYTCHFHVSLKHTHTR